MSLRERLRFSTEPVFLMDASAYVFRSFYANQNMSRADGFATNVLFSVFRMLLKIIREEQPEYFAFILDGRGKNFRHQLYEAYKANRQATPEPLSAQIPPLCRGVQALGLFNTFSDNCEADDCIAALAARFSPTRPVVIIGADKDLRQCLNPNVYIWDPSNKEERLNSLAAFEAEYGFPPALWPDYQALIGDSSDNIPGVPGIGPKGAGTLIKDFGGLEELEKRLPAIPPALRKKLEGHFDEAYLCRRLTTLDLAVCPNIGLEDLRPRTPDGAELDAIFEEYGLRSLQRETSSMNRVFKSPPKLFPPTETETPPACAGWAEQLAQGASQASESSGQGVQGMQGGQLVQGTQGAGSNKAPGKGKAAAKPAQGPASLPLFANSAAGNPVANEGQDWAQGSLFSPAQTGGALLLKQEELAALPRLTLNENTTHLRAFLAPLLEGKLTELALCTPADFDLENAGPAVLAPVVLPPAVLDKPHFVPPVQVELVAAHQGGAVLLTANSESALAHFCAELSSLLAQKPALRVLVPELKGLLGASPALGQLFEGPAFANAALDLSLAGWLLSPEEYAYDWPRLSLRWGAEIAAGQKGCPDASVAEAACSLAAPLPAPLAAIFALGRVFAERLGGLKLDPVLRELEQPLVPVLAGMQNAGIGIDKAAFAAFLQETEKELEALTGKIHDLAGMPFNIRSSRQMGEVLFDVLKLPKSGKTQGGQNSTSQEALEKLLGKHPVIEAILEYRVLEKLRSTYLDPMPRLADAAGRLHTTFNQNATATGRLSSSNPNLQNIPVRGEHGPRMRACFRAAPGKLLVSADYSQIELRVLAHLSQDANMLGAFQRGEDIHASTAALLYGVEQAQITPDQRRNAKTINFGLIYGMGAQKLGRELGISLKEAKEFMERYFSKLTGLKRYFERIEAEAKEHGFVSTMTGRRRPCPEIFSANQQLQSRARRQAINTCIQGTAADIIKLAMLAVAGDPALKALQATLVLQIHDELLLEAPAENAKAVGQRCAELMGAVKPGGVELAVSLAVDWGTGENWAQAH